MSNIIKYSVLRYSPSIVSGESINLGVLFSSDDYREFRYTRKYNRIREFDDTLDIDTLKVLLSSIAEEVNPDIISLNKSFSIESYVRFYCKEYCFSPIYSIAFSNIKKTIDDIMRIYLRFDFDIKQRPNSKQELAFLRSILSSQGQKVQSNSSCIGAFSEQVRFDMIFGNYGIKYFHFSSKKDLKKVMNDVKAWAWNCENQSIINPIIVYSTDITSEDTERSSQLKSILSIFAKATKNVFNIEETANRLPELTK